LINNILFPKELIDVSSKSSGDVPEKGKWLAIRHNSKGSAFFSQEGEVTSILKKVTPLKEKAVYFSGLIHFSPGT
jgi:hypothetical protein